MGAREAAPKFLSWGQYVPLVRCGGARMPPERCADGAQGARHPRVVYSNLFFLLIIRCSVHVCLTGCFQRSE